MKNFSKSYVYYPLYYIWEIFSIPVRDHFLTVEGLIGILLAQASKGIDGVSIKDSKLVEFIASLLEVRETECSSGKFSHKYLG
jgi:hypothetical protein